MVCKCFDDTIQLWSLRTSKQLWKRDVRIQYDADPYCDPSFFLDAFEPYYRSVVFHPTQDLVLPGILSHAYTFDGDRKPLFPSSKCDFQLCSISAEKIMMLTDCTKDGKSIITWSLTDGSEINRFTWSNEILSFAWSRDGRLLAISDLSGSIGLLDVMDGYRTLARRTISVGINMIKFSPDCRCLYCVNSDYCDLFRFDVNMENDGTCSLAVLPDKVSYHPWEFKSYSETGFLLGDPFCLPFERDTTIPLSPGLAFVLNKQSVLGVSSRGITIEMLQLDELTKDGARDPTTTLTKVVLSLNGDTLFVIITTFSTSASLMAWDISSGRFKPGKRVFEDTGGFGDYNLVAVREGVLLQTSRDTLELWNFELSECIRSWTDLGDITEVVPISEERVACDGGRKVIMVDTTREGILSTILIHGDFVACNSKCHVITADDMVIQMQCGDVVFWEIFNPVVAQFYRVLARFSPTEQYCVLIGPPGEALYVLGVVSGKILRRIQPRTHKPGILAKVRCEFVSDECIVYFIDGRGGHFLQLFNVKSGDLLNEIAMESNVYSLAACPSKRLIAISFTDSKMNFKVLRVKLPGDKHSRKSKRIKPKE